ncbi:MAG: SGNH/GDSL hydrolase family protein [Bacteroidales bacterium]|nr:SGNH/GDSL hydrolase family protein [Bacteroidales bacterium]
MKYKSILFILILAILFACEPKTDDFSPSKGSADFTSYIAIGNSLTAGYADGALYTSGQKYSFPNILANQLKTVGMEGEFKQPIINTENGVGVSGSSLVTKFILNYSTDCYGITSVGPVRAVKDPDQATLQAELFTSVASQGPFNNIGIPSLKSIHVFAPNYGTLNPYYGRFAENPAADPVIDEFGKIDYTFFTLWLGNNDVLSYALAGGDGEVITPMPGTPGIGFAASMDAIITDLTYFEAKGAVANIPDIMSIPYFTFMQTQIPYNGLVLVRQGQVDSLNAAYQPLGITFSLGQNPFIVTDATSGYPRKMKETDIFLLSLPTDSLKCFGFGSSIPIPHKYILDETEIGKINTAVTEFNVKIKDLALLHNAVLVDMNSYLDEFITGMDFDGIHFSSKFISGNLFSLDGIHLTPQGNAIVANYFIDKINAAYNANIPKVSISDYPNVQFP